MDEQPPPTGEFLNKAELRDLTGAARSRAQAAWLVDHGVPHRLDGPRVVVSRYQVRQWLLGERFEAMSAGGFNWNLPGMDGYDPSKPPDWDPRK